MKRDFDIIRSILLAVENSAGCIDPVGVAHDGATEDEISYNMALVLDARLCTGESMWPDGATVPYVRIDRLTWAGHDFLDACRDDARWRTVKVFVKKANGLTFEVLKGILVDLGKEAVKRLLIQP